ncbi:hypothetical protein EMIT053CA3_120059 [Pseudomonas donghuensis]
MIHAGAEEPKIYGLKNKFLINQ